MSWLSEFLHSPLDYVSENPLKALSLLAAPVAAIAAPFALPALGGALGIGGAAGAAGGAGAAGAGILGAEAGGLLAGAGGLGAAEGAAGAGLLGGSDILASLGLGGEFGADALGAFASGAGEVGGASGTWIPEFGLDSIYGGIGAFDSPGVAASLGGEGISAGAGVSAGGGGGGLSGISLDPLMSGAPMAGSADAAAFAAEPGWWSKLGTGAMDSIMKNPVGTALAGGGLAYSMMQGQQKSPEMEAMAASAAGLNEQGKQLMSYLQSGTLPPGLQTAVSNATASMKARIISNHARNGQSTNPSQNSALAQELNQVDLNSVALIAQQGQQLLQSGMTATNMSTQLYGMLENMNRQSSQRMGQAIANFAAALSGPRVNVNIGGQRQAA